MKKYFLIICFFSLFFTGISHASETREFKYTSLLRGVTGENKIHRFMLSLEILVKIGKKELADLRIFNQDNLEVPYLIYDSISKKEYDEFPIYNPETKEDESGNTIIDINDLNFSCDSILIETDQPYYYRSIEVYAKTTNDIFKLKKKSMISKLADVEVVKNIIHTNLKKISDLRIKIINKDSPSLSIKKVVILCEQKNIIFIPVDNDLYSIYYGSDKVSAPHYDLKKVITLRDKSIEDIPLMTIGQVNKNLKYSKKINFSKGFLFAAIFFLIVGMSYWIYKLIKKLDERK